MYKRQALPYDRHVNVDAVLNQLAATGFITRYAVGDQAVIHITNFAKHQSPHVRESKSELPEIRESIIKAMPKHNLGSAEASPRSPDSLFPLPDSLVNPLVVSELTPCPHQEIISLYAELLPELPQIRKWEGTRPKHLKARWGWVLKDLESKGKLYDNSAGVDFFRLMFEYISTRDFLMGRTGVWTASLPWIVEDENFTKIIEGNYICLLYTSLGIVTPFLNSEPFELINIESVFRIYAEPSKNQFGSSLLYLHKNLMH